MTSEEHINSESNKDYDVDDMDGVSDELETHDFEEPTEEQKAFYLRHNPRDIKQKEEWFPTEKKASNKDDDKKNPNDPKIKKALDISQKFTHKLFIDAYKEPYAAVPIEDHIEVFAINSKKFRNWIRMIVYNKEGITIDGQTLNDLCSLLAAYAEFQNKEQIDLHLRNASNADGELEWRYDLTNKNWEFVKITSKYWDIIKNQIVFKRYNNQQPQVYPLKDYEPDVFDTFMKLVNIKNDDEDVKLLLKCYIVSLFIPDIQKPILMVHGSQGSAKSSLQEMIKMIVDPSVVKTLSFPRGMDELIQQMAHNYVVCYDNISTIKEYISDQLCRAVSGSGSSKRELYTSDDDIIYSFKRCVAFNGINLGATKGDLLDRGLIIELQRIEEERQLKPEDLWKRFEEIKPHLLGYVFDILVKVLDWKNNVNRPQLKLDRLPRMAEFAEYGEMISRCMGNPSNLFIDAYRKNIKLQSQEVVEASTIASTIIQLMNSRDDDWVGTSTYLLSELEYVAETLKINIKSKSWPKGPNILSRRIKEIKVNLKQFGIDIDFSKTQDKNRTRTIIIRKIPSEPSEPSDVPIHAQNLHNSADATLQDYSIPSTIPSENNHQNYAQNHITDDTDDVDDTLHDIKENQNGI